MTQATVSRIESGLHVSNSHTHWRLSSAMSIPPSMILALAEQPAGSTCLVDALATAAADPKRWRTIRRVLRAAAANTVAWQMVQFLVAEEVGETVR